MYLIFSVRMLSSLWLQSTIFTIFYIYSVLECAFNMCKFSMLYYQHNSNYIGNSNIWSEILKNKLLVNFCIND